MYSRRSVRSETGHVSEAANVALVLPSLEKKESGASSLC